MRLSFLLFSILSISNLGLSQISITNTTFPSKGDVLKMAVSDDANINVGTTNGPQIWDFNSLTSGFLIEEEYLDISEGSDPGAFPNAQLVLKVEGSERYLKSSANKLEIVGVGGENDFIPVEVNVNYTKFPTLRRAPLNFIDSNNGESEFNVAFSSTILPEALLAVLPVKPDSIRIQFVSTSRGTVDAYGTLKIQNEEFQVLREKTEVISETKAGLKVFGIWLDAAGFISILPEAFSDFLGKDTSFTYNFYSDVRKEILVSAEYSVLNQLETVTFVNLGNVTSGTEESSTFPTLSTLFPNPTSDILTVKVPELKDGSYALTISDLQGKYVYFQTITAQAGVHEEINMQQFLPGQYILTLRNKHNSLVLSSQFVVQR